MSETAPAAPDYRLISFPVCPFVQRSVIVLKRKGVPFEIDYIDILDKPQWFVDLVPSGKVPVLMASGEAIFESAIINEFIDETTPPPMLPADPLKRARQRAWISYAEKLIIDQFKTMTATDADAYENAKAALLASMARLSEIAPERKSAQEIDMLDASIAPQFMRLQLMAQYDPGLIDDLDPASGTPEWIQWLMATDEVKSSVRETFQDEWKAYFLKRESYLLREGGS